MADQTTQRLRLIAAVGGTLLFIAALSAAMPSCWGCGSIQFEDPEQAHMAEEDITESIDAQIGFAVVGMSIVGLAGFLAQFAWSRHKAGERIVTDIR